ncbi:MAG TPA: hypothetical protein VM661_13640 [Candidatus Sulfotelmatobacter sp.]|jgi:hypothetical protein|nr:hypothetical protein [Candidatus Sulfotelmatobacter sp.]
MTSVGNILNTHTGTVRIVGMVPVGARANGPDYNQALTQALGGDSASPSTAVTTDISAAGQAAAAQQGSDATNASTPAPVQTLFVSDPDGDDDQTKAGESGGDGQGDMTASGRKDSANGPQSASGQNADGQNGNGDDNGDGADKTDAAEKSGKPAHWEPSGSAKIAALYRNTEKLAAGQDGNIPTSGDGLSILG